MDEENTYLICNNGSDGADWSINNIRTGGAGAYAYVVSIDKIKSEFDAYETACSMGEMQLDRMGITEKYSKYLNDRYPQISRRVLASCGIVVDIGDSF